MFNSVSSDIMVSPLQLCIVTLHILCSLHYIVILNTLIAFPLLYSLTLTFSSSQDNNHNLTNPAAIHAFKIHLESIYSTCNTKRHHIHANVTTIPLCCPFIQCVVTVIFSAYKHAL